MNTNEILNELLAWAQKEHDIWKAESVRIESAYINGNFAAYEKVIQKIQELQKLENKESQLKEHELETYEFYLILSSGLKDKEQTMKLAQAFSNMQKRITQLEKSVKNLQISFEE